MHVIIPLVLGIVFVFAAVADAAATIPLTVHTADAAHYLSAAVAPIVFTIPEFCDACRISRSWLYKEWRAGRGPRWIRFGYARRISHEAAAEYARANERAPSNVTTADSKNTSAANPREKRRRSSAAA